MHRALQSRIGPGKVDILILSRQTLLGVDVVGNFGGFRQHVHHIVVHVGKAAGNEDMRILAVDAVTQIANGQCR